MLGVTSGTEPITTPPDKFTRQDDAYRFPYHYIPHLDSGGGAVTVRSLGWGLEYLCCLYHVRSLVEELEPSDLLDVGCGDGRFLNSLEGLVDRRVGVDPSERAIRHATAFNPNAEFVVGTAGDLGGRFDVVTCIEVMEHVPDGAVEAFLSETVARLNSDGHLIVSVPTRQVPLLAKHYRHYDLELLRRQVRQARVPLEEQRVDFVYKSRGALLFGLWRRLASNRWWTLDIPVLRKLVWRYVWVRHRMADEDTGRHLVALYRRTPAYVHLSGAGPA